MNIPQDIAARIDAQLQPNRLTDTAFRLVEVPSPTCSAGAVADRLAEILQADGFDVERPEASWPAAPAVVVRFATGRPGKTLQFNGHLDTVHLPFVPPKLEDGLLTGSGASDMKGGIAAAVEALRVLRDSDVLPGGSVMLTAHDLHESPWGDNSQVHALIDAGYVGDGVLLPEYQAATLPIVGRGLALFDIRITRPGEPVHEVVGGIEQPSVVEAGANVIRRLTQLDRELSARTHPLAGRESLFIGQVASGEIYNQAPVEFRLQGTRRWLPDSNVADAKQQFHRILSEVDLPAGVQVDARFNLARESFEIAPDDPLVRAFQSAHATATGGELPLGAKPFVDDGNTFVRRANVPAITHGPHASGAHTLYEKVTIDELVRVARVYALTAVAFCGPR